MLQLFLKSLLVTHGNGQPNCLKSDIALANDCVSPYYGTVGGKLVCCMRHAAAADGAVVMRDDL